MLKSKTCESQSDFSGYAVTSIQLNFSLLSFYLIIYIFRFPKSMRRFIPAHHRSFIFARQVVEEFRTVNNSQPEGKAVKQFVLLVNVIQNSTSAKTDIYICTLLRFTLGTPLNTLTAERRLLCGCRYFSQRMPFIIIVTFLYTYSTSAKRIEKLQFSPRRTFIQP
ncbi:hypothetical protein GQX74_003051 [Glossina fuscipes]|nr:hypothetical protein GQX74_003051 [Glossina fuscipes]